MLIGSLERPSLASPSPPASSTTQEPPAMARSTCTCRAVARLDGRGAAVGLEALADLLKSSFAA